MSKPLIAHKREASPTFDDEPQAKRYHLEAGVGGAYAGSPGRNTPSLIMDGGDSPSSDSAAGIDSLLAAQDGVSPFALCRENAASLPLGDSAGHNAPSAAFNMRTTFTFGAYGKAIHAPDVFSSHGRRETVLRDTGNIEVPAKPHRHQLAASSVSTPCPRPQRIAASRYRHITGTPLHRQPVPSALELPDSSSRQDTPGEGRFRMCHPIPPAIAVDSALAFALPGLSSVAEPSVADRVPTCAISSDPHARPATSPKPLPVLPSHTSMHKETTALENACVTGPGQAALAVLARLQRTFASLEEDNRRLAEALREERAARALFEGQARGMLDSKCCVHIGWTLC